jgi:hypothetical protein
LHASLAAWRDAYCDTEAEWKACARYERALHGQAVPLALLPNGKIVGMVAEHEHDHDHDASADGSGHPLADGARELPTKIKPSLWRRLFGKEK